MGFSWAVVIGQAITTFLVSKVPGVDLTGHSEDQVHVEVYIDNVIFVGSQIAIKKACEAFRAVCARYNVTLSEDSGPVTAACYRGVKFDFNNKSFALDESFVEKFRSRLAAADGSWCDWRALLGSAVYALTALSVPLGPYYHVLRWLARNVRTSPVKHVKMWTQAAEEWDKAVALILLNRVGQGCGTHSPHLTNPRTDTFANH